MLCVVGRSACRSSRSLGIRYYSVPTTSQSSTSTSSSIPHVRKQKIDLRPAPIKPIQKPTPLSANNILSSANPLSQAQSLSATPKLAEAKEEVQLVIHDAEIHGILKPPPPDANWFKRTLHTAIQLLKFYYRGVKLIFTRRKEIALIKQRIATGGDPLTRAEFRLIQTQKDDIKKVVPFLIMAILLEEVIPLVAIYVPSMLPSTCILPAQRQRIEEKRAEKVLTFSMDHRHVYAELRRLENPTGYLPVHLLRLSGASTAICGLLGISTLGIDFFRIRRIRRHLDFIAKDDKLLQNDAGKCLSTREHREALEERGIPTRGLSHKELQARLAWWLQSVKAATEDVNDEVIARRLALVISSR